jgi:molybdenum cofactor biosynthesis protein B
MAHRGDAPAAEGGCGILTVSDSRDLAHDLSGAAVNDLLVAGGYRVVWHEVVRDERAAIRAALAGALERTDVVAVVINGGTGIADRDVTIEILEGLWSRVARFRRALSSLSFAEIRRPFSAGRRRESCAASSSPSSQGRRRRVTRDERLLVPSLRHIAALLAPHPRRSGSCSSRICASGSVFEKLRSRRGAVVADV